MGEREVVGEQGDLFEQRWRDKRSTWAPLHTLFDPSRYEVVIINQDKVAKTFVTHHHYSGTYPAARFRVGLVRDDDLVGVAIFSTPASQKVLPRYAEITPDEGVELGRFVLLDDVAFNGESWFLARAFKLLKRVVRLWGEKGEMTLRDRTRSHGVVKRSRSRRAARKLREYERTTLDEDF